METTDTVREKSLQDYRKKLLEHKEIESKLKQSIVLILALYLEPKLKIAGFYKFCEIMLHL